MAKKFITLSNQARKYKLFSDDIRRIHQRLIKKLSLIPNFEIVVAKHDKDDTE